MSTPTAQIAKTFTDGTVDILTLPVTTARAHVAARTAHADSYGLASISVRIDTTTYAWAPATGWTKPCDNADTEHPGFPCAHPAH